jgi:hypothetical protein
VKCDVQLCERRRVVMAEWAVCIVRLSSFQNTHLKLQITMVLLIPDQSTALQSICTKKINDAITVYCYKSHY